MPLECIGTGDCDKVTRAVPLIVRLEHGEILLPLHDNGWRSTLEAEWLGWTGLPDEVCDQIDAAAYAATEADAGRGDVVKLERVFWR